MGAGVRAVAGRQRDGPLRGPLGTADRLQSPSVNSPLERRQLTNGVAKAPEQNPAAKGADSQL